MAHSSSSTKVFVAAAVLAFSSPISEAFLLAPSHPPNLALHIAIDRYGKMERSSSRSTSHRSLPASTLPRYSHFSSPFDRQELVGTGYNSRISRACERQTARLRAQSGQAAANEAAGKAGNTAPPNDPPASTFADLIENPLLKSLIKFMSRPTLLPSIVPPLVDKLFQIALSGAIYLFHVLVIGHKTVTLPFGFTAGAKTTVLSWETLIGTAMLTGFLALAGEKVNIPILNRVCCSTHSAYRSGRLPSAVGSGPLSGSWPSLPDNASLICLCRLPSLCSDAPTLPRECKAALSG